MDREERDRLLHELHTVEVLVEGFDVPRGLATAGSKYAGETKQEAMERLGIAPAAPGEPSQVD